jgi:aminomethyltransferase
VPIPGQAPDNKPNYQKEHAMAEDGFDDNPTELQQTPLYALHVNAGARMVPFAGYSMPVQFPQGILKEHLHTRSAAGLFDVSHMGQIVLRGTDVAAALEALLPVDVQGLPLHQLSYALLTNECGGILDDLMVTRWSPDSCYLVVNADCKAQDIAHLRSQLPASIEIEVLSDRALLALQGPAARSVISRLLPAAADLHFMRGMSGKISGYDCYISCSGYTGEDGFEISVAAADARALAEILLLQDAVQPVGLGARDSLRMEAGLCLYGHDLDPSTTPVEADLAWSISAARRLGGVREGGFPGAQPILEQMVNGAPKRRVGLAIEGRAPVREGVELVNEDGAAVGQVCSGGFGPSLGAPLAMAYVRSDCATVGTTLQAIVRGRPRPVVVAKLPFVARRYYRG